MVEMKLLGIHFTKILGTRNPEFSGKITMSQNINIKNLEKVKPTSTKEEALKVSFSFEIDYKELGNVSIEGFMYLELESKTLKEALKKWEKKEVDKEFQIILLNLVLQRASIKAFQLEEELGLPVHVKLPKIQAKS